MTSWSLRYTLYAAAHDKTPKQMLAHDREAWPGGQMCGFILWISAHWRRWFVEIKGRRRGDFDYISDEDHAHYDAWLREQYLHEGAP